MNPVKLSGPLHGPAQPGGVDKPRGLENAALQHERKALRDTPAAIVTLTAQVPEAVTYSRDGLVHDASAGSGSGSSSFSLGDDSQVHINSRVAGAASGSSTLIIGDNSRVHINSRVAGDASGSSTLIVGDNSRVHINSRAGSTSGSDTLVVGDNAKVHINQRVESDLGSDTILVGDGATLHLNTRTRVDASSDVLVVPEGAKLFVHERDSARSVLTQSASDARFKSAAHYLSARAHGQDAALDAENSMRREHRLLPERTRADARPGHAQFDSFAYMMQELVGRADEHLSAADVSRDAVHGQKPQEAARDEAFTASVAGDHTA